MREHKLTFKTKENLSQGNACCCNVCFVLSMRQKHKKQQKLNYTKVSTIQIFLHKYDKTSLHEKLIICNSFYFSFY